MTGADIAALKQYVQGPDGGMQNRDASTVLLQVSHSNLAARFLEIRLDKHVSWIRYAFCYIRALLRDGHLLLTPLCSIAQWRLHERKQEISQVYSSMQMSVMAVKIKLTAHCGTAANSMELQLMDDRGKLKATLLNDRQLGYYSPHDGYDGCSHTPRVPLKPSLLTVASVKQVHATYHRHGSAFTFGQWLVRRCFKGGKIRDVRGRLSATIKYLQKIQSQKARGACRVLHTDPQLGCVRRLNTSTDVRSDQSSMRQADCHSAGDWNPVHRRMRLGL